jgi:PucR family transcriptional regulator, purine catabolism regulatory protein
MTAPAAPDAGDGIKGITVGQLAQIPHLQTRVVAGHGGLDRRVTWAHVSDVKSPWDWHDPGDLVLTSGGIVPDDPAGQVDFITRLNDAGLSGLVIGDTPACPPLSEEMLSEADKLDFPLLCAEEQASFTWHIRAVASANQGDEIESLRQIMHVHDEVRQCLSRQRSSREFVDSLSRVLGSPIYVVESKAWEPTLPGCEAPDLTWRDAWCHEVGRREGRVPLVMRLRSGDKQALSMPVPIERDVVLVVMLDDRDPPRLAVLQHVASACALEVAHIDAGLERDRRAGTALLAEAMQGLIDAKVLETRVVERGLTFPCVCLSFEAPPEVVDGLARNWTVRGIRHLLGGLEPSHIAVISSDDDLLDELADGTADQQFHIGVSDPFSGASGLRDAVRQARWAMESARPGEPKLARYGDAGETFLPRTLAESRIAAERVLGPVIEYDQAHETDLIKTLETYLFCDRSPKRAAEKLFVHTQTVAYRINRVQEMTGRSMKSSRDISELWFGLRAMNLSEILAREKN